MTTFEKLEVAIIVLISFCVFFLASALPDKLGLGRLLLYASALLLLQSLIRDLLILFRHQNKDQQPQKMAQCMCLESTVGIVGIVIGTMLLGLGLDQPVIMTNMTWTITVVVVLGVGFAVKDFVFEWSPFRIYRDKDHMNIIFTRKR